MTYFSTHNHTAKGSNLRLIDSINTVKSLFDRATEVKLKGFCITDHEALCSHVEAIQEYKKRKDNNTLPKDFVLGLGDEIYLIDELGDYQPLGYTHFILLAKNKEGHRLLREISSTAWENSYKSRGMERTPITKEQLSKIVKKNPGKLIAQTACLGSELSKLVLLLVEAEKNNKQTEVNEIKQRIMNFLNYCINLFGKDDFYIEVQPSASKEQSLYNKRVKEIAKALGLKLVFSTDSHYESAERRFFHKAYLNSKDGEREVDDFYATAYMMSEEELKDYLLKDFSNEEFETMKNNSLEIANKIEFYDLYKQQEIPLVDVKNYPILNEAEEYEYLNLLYKSEFEQDRYWVNTCVNFLKEKNKYNDKYLSRLNEEAKDLWEISIKMNQRMTGYYNTMKLILELAWNGGNSLIGPARGSATGFLSCYALGITQLDPIEHNLPAWRHLTATRPELPDVDCDSQANRRVLILQTIKDFFGHDNVLSIATFGKEGSKSACSTACRGYRSEEFPEGLDVEVGLYLSSLIPSERGNQWPLKDVVYGNEEKDRKPVREFINECNKYPKLLDIMMSIEGLPNKRSIHASGIYIYNNGYLELNAMMKAPNGLEITQFDMSDSDYMGSLKYDMLTVEALDKISVAIEMLTKDGYMEWQGSLRETYDKYLHPDTLPYQNQEVWNLMATGEVINCFQFDTEVGSICAKKVKPHSLADAASANSLMRLMGEKGGEQPVDRYIRMKNNISLWYEEMNERGLTKEEQKILEPHYLPVYGTPNTQEDMMETLMNPQITNFDLTLANKARKIVAKKKAEEVSGFRELYNNKGIEAGNRQVFLDYVWDTCIKSQLGYSFSRNHTTPYTTIALQELQIYHKYPSVYWNTACLTVNAGSVEGSSTDYAKVAKAIGEIKKGGAIVSLIDINSSDLGFRPDAKNNQILFGLKGVANINDDLIHEIIKNRPYNSMMDYLEKTPTGKQQMISLIKGGAFDKIENKPRTEIMYDYISHVADTKKKLTLQNFAGLIEKGVLPFEELELQIRTFVFNKSLKKNCSKDNYLILTGTYLDFYNKFFDTDELEVVNGYEAILESKWKKMYNKCMDKAREWLKNNHDLALEAYNNLIIKEEWDKYCKGNTSAWEMESLCFYHGEHELAKVNQAKYGVSNFSDLVSMEQDGSFMRNGVQIPLMKISRIMGTVLSKNKTKGVVSLLTTEGVVNVKFRLEQFAHYDRQITEIQPDGTKKVIEKSWFKRGEKLIITGFRRDDTFVCKKYSKTPGHSIYKIEEVLENGDIRIKHERA